MSNKKLAIIGAGSLGVMALDAAICQNQFDAKNIVFIDDGKDVGQLVHGFEVIGSTELLHQLSREEDYSFFIAIADNRARKKIAERFHLPYINIIHPEAVVSHLAVIGKGNILLPNVTVDPETIIEDHVIVNKNTSLGHNVTLKSYSQVCPGCQLAGTIGESTFIGLGATVLPNIEVGDRSTIGAGAVVTKNIPDDRVAVGIPAKVKKES